nr:glutathione binding-like protein [Alphaproteobacteria bacterium]
EQYSHEPFIGVARSWLTHFPDDETRMAQLPEKQAGGRAALAVMDAHLAQHKWFVGDRYSIADIALYVYTHVAGEGGIELAPYQAVRGWLDRVAAQPGHVPIDWTPQAT